MIGNKDFFKIEVLKRYFFLTKFVPNSKLLDYKYVNFRVLFPYV